MPVLNEGLTGRLGGGIVAPSMSAATGTDPSRQLDVLIGGIGFCTANSLNRPYLRETAEYRKQQVDTSSEPGEQSLNNWWLRSQISFHLGAGRMFAEQADPSDAAWENQFDASQGVDVWTAGQATLLPEMLQVTSTSTTAGICGGTDPSDQSGVLLGWAGSTLSWYKVSGDSVTSGTVTWGGTGTILDCVTDGTRYYVSNATGIYTGTLPAGSGSLIWNSGANVKLGWVKQRLIAGIGNVLYELAVPNTGAATLPTPKYTHPNPAWVWTAISETPDAIYVAGYAGGNSAIYKMLLDTSVDPPILTPPIVAAQLPFGEVVQSLTGYMGGYLAVGTNKWVRIAIRDSYSQSGTIIMGAPSVPLSGPLAVAGALPCYAAIGDDRFIYGSYGNAMPDGTSGLFRLDLSQLVSNSKFAYAPDLQTHANGPVTKVAHWGSRKALLLSGSGIWFDRASTLEPSGWLRTGRVRFHTLEPKYFKFVQMRATPLVGGLQATVIDANGNANGLAAQNAPPGLQPLADQYISLSSQEYVALRFDLTRSGTDATQGPTFRGYSLKGWPATKRQRQETLTLTIRDFEQDRDGVVFGHPGFALERLAALEALEEGSDAVMVQHLTTGPGVLPPRLCVIDKVSFEQTMNPQRDDGFGGQVTVIVRSIT